MAVSATIMCQKRCFPLSSSSSFFANSYCLSLRRSCNLSPKKPIVPAPNPVQIYRHLVIARAGPGSTDEYGVKEDGGSSSSSSGRSEDMLQNKRLVSMDRNSGMGGAVRAIGEFLPPEGFVVFTACVVGILTGIGVVLFNIAVHEIRDFFGDGIPSPDASWFREHSLEENWKRVVLVPACGGVVVGILNTLRSRLESSSEGDNMSDDKASFRSFLKTAAATVTLGTGNSLGPEGPSVEIGASIAGGIGKVLQTSKRNRLSLVAAGSAAGISSGFNAPVAGCFFAVESVLWPSSADSSPSIINTTSMVILSAFTASVISQAGLGADPTFTVPIFDFRSPAELPLYVLLGILSGLVSVALLKATKYATLAIKAIKEQTELPFAIFPVFGGTLVGLIALAYPEVLYRGFENVNILLESQPNAKGLPADILLQLVGAKIIATSLSRASQLVGGYYAPSLFIGAALGSAYGKIASYVVTLSGPNYTALEVAPPEAYALVGMAATLAGVCQVPLTSVLLLFELTQDYRIVVPLMGAVGFSSWISSAFAKKDEKPKAKNLELDDTTKNQYSLNSEKEMVSCSQQYNSGQPIAPDLFQSLPSSTFIETNKIEFCEIESSLCVGRSTFEPGNLEEYISVGSAMRADYLCVFEDTSVEEAVVKMVTEKEWCALIIDGDKKLKGILTLGDIELCGKTTKAGSKLTQISRLSVSEVCRFLKEGSELLTISPYESLKQAKQLMAIRGLRQLPVVEEPAKTRDNPGPVLGLIDRESIQLACRMEATKRIIGFPQQLIS